MYEQENEISNFAASCYRVFLAYADDSHVHAVCVRPDCLLDYWERASSVTRLRVGSVVCGVLWSETVANDLDRELAEFLLVQAMICGHSRVRGRKGY